jgi:hypothetical protein
MGDTLRRAEKLARRNMTQSEIEAAERADARETVDLVKQARREQREAEWALEDQRQAELSGETDRAQHRARALEIASIRRKLKRSQDGHIHRAADILGDRVTERLSDSEYESFRVAAERAYSDTKLRDLLGDLQRREERKASVTSEPGPYGPDSPHSWFADRLIVADSGTDMLGGLRELAGACRRGRRKSGSRGTRLSCAQTTCGPRSANGRSTGRFASTPANQTRVRIDAGCVRRSVR